MFVCFVHQEKPRLVHQLSWEVQYELQTYMNPLKDPTGNDWRLLASRLGLEANAISELEKESNPTKKLLELCPGTEIKELLQVLSDMKRTDAHEAVIKKLGMTSSDAEFKYPMQESPTDSMESGLSWPLQDSGHGR